MALIVKRCACGRTYTAEEWQRLPRHRQAVDVVTFADGQTAELRMRDCRCGSTLALWEVGHEVADQDACEALADARLADAR